MESRYKKRYYVNNNHKKGWKVILISNRIDFKTKYIIIGDKDGHQNMIKGSINQEENNHKYACEQ